MKLNKIFICTLLCTFSSFFTSCISEDIEDEEGYMELKAGDTLPDFKVTLNDGILISTDSLRGHVAIIFFFHTQCHDCQRELPILQKIYDDTTCQNIKIFGISRKENAASIQAFWEKNQLTLPYSAQENDKIYHQFAKSIVPRVYITDTTLTIRNTFTDNPITTYEDLKNSIKSCIN